MKKERWFIYVSWQGEHNVSAYQSEKQLEWAKNNPGRDAPYSTVEKETPSGERVIFYKEKHALAYGTSMKEYLGMIELDPGNAEDRKILDMKADEIRVMNLPKVQPNKEVNKVISKGGNTYLWADYFKNRHGL